MHGSSACECIPHRSQHTCACLVETHVPMGKSCEAFQRGVASGLTGDKRTLLCMPLRATLPGGTEGSARTVKTLRMQQGAQAQEWRVHSDRLGETGSYARRSPPTCR